MSKLVSGSVRFSAAAIVLLAGAPALAWAQQSRASARDRSSNESRDSLLARVRYDQEIERLLRALTERSMQQSALTTQLRQIEVQRRDNQNAAALDVAHRAVSERLRAVTELGVSLRERLTSLCPPQTVPDGWMGVTFSSTMAASRTGDGPVSYRFLESPVVESVDPGSPAERAGMQRGDRIVLLDGVDVRSREFDFVQLLKPGSRLPIRVIRDGQARDVTLRIVRRPQTVVQHCPWMDTRVAAAFAEASPGVTVVTRGGIGFAAPEPADAFARVQTRTGPRVARAPEAPPFPPSPSTPVAARAPAEAPMIVALPSTPAIAYAGRYARRALVAGAELVQLNEGLQAVVGTDEGVFVIDVARGTPAAAAGLRGGDVIVSAGGVSVSHPVTLQRVIESSDNHEVTLKVIRPRQPGMITLVLRW